MNKATVWLVVSAIIVLGVLSPAITEVPKPPRHIDPSSAHEEGPSPTELLVLYMSVADSISKYDFSSAKNNLSLASNVYVPENLKYIINRFNDLLNNLIGYENNTMNCISSAENAINRSDISLAKKFIREGILNLTKAKIIYDELSAAARDLVRLGIPLQKLDTILSRISDSLDRLEKELQSLKNSLEKLRNLTETFLQITVDPRNITVGDTITIHGYLVDEWNNPLTNRSIIIHIGKTTLKTLTDINGSFTIHRQINIYEHLVKVYAEYVPKGGDYNKYKYSRSNIVYLTIYFVKPSIELELHNKSVLPGDTIFLHIKTLSNLQLIVETSFTKELKLGSGNGSLTLSFQVPLNISEGVYAVTVRSLPNGSIGPAEARAYFKVYRLEPRVVVDIQKYVLTGIPYTFKVICNVDSIITVSSDEVGYSFEGEGGIVEARIVVPHTYLGTRLGLLVKVTPLDHRYRSKTLVVSVNTYNSPALILSILPIAALAIYIVYSRTKILQEKAPVTTLEPVQHPIESPPIKSFLPENISGLILPLYRELVWVIEKVSGVRFRGSYTFREYLASIRNTLPGTIYSFVEKVFIGLEKIAYGGSKYLQNKFVNPLNRMLRDLVMVLREYLEKMRGGE